jgi:hypothetical protein
VINGVNVPNGADIINIQAANNSWGIDIVGGSATGQSYGMIVTAGTNGSDVTMQIRSPVGGNYLLIYGNGSVQMVTTAGLLVGNTTFKGTAANTPVLSVNTSVTTGSAAANITSNTQASANKPGRPNTIVGWLPIYHDGIEGYIPIWGS